MRFDHHDVNGTLDHCLNQVSCLQSMLSLVNPGLCASSDLDRKVIGCSRSSHLFLRSHSNSHYN